jgi:hypothetical protein
MAVDTKPNLNSCKFEQYSGETLNLSGCTDIYGIFNIASGASFCMSECAGLGRVITSDAYGKGMWQNTTTGIVNACNGLTTDGITVCLGGTIITGTTILNPSYTFLVSGATNSSFCSVIQSPYYYPFSYVEQTIISQTSNDILLQACHNTQGRAGGIFISTITGNTNVMHLFAAGGDSGTASGDIVLEGTSYGVTISGMCTNFHTPIKIYSTPTVGTTSDALLVWDSGDKLVKQIAVSAITSGGTGGETITGATNGLSVSGKNIALGGTLTGETFIYAQDTVSNLHWNNQYFHIGMSGTTGQAQLDVNGCILNTITLQAGSATSLTVNGGIADDYVEIGTTGGDSIRVDGINDCIAITSSNIILPTAPADGACTDSVLVIDGTGLIKKVPYISGDTGGVTVAQFTGYTATTEIRIGDLESWSGTSQPIIAAAITGATNLGSGNGTIYTTTSDKNIQLKTLSGGTNVTLTCDANYIAINSTAAGGGIGWSNLTNGSTVAGCGTMASGATTCNTYYGVCVGCSTTGSGNTAMGSYAAKSLTCGKNNVAIGYQAFCGNVKGCNSVAIGFQANMLSGCGCENVAVGYQAFYGNVYGERNIAIGSQALFCNNGGLNNVAFGACALCCNTSGGYNFAMGYQSMINNVTGGGNIAIGYQSLYGSACGDCNIGLGYYTLGANICGCDNIALGWAALGNNTCGKWNIGFGCRAAIGNTKGCHNIAIGCEALNNNSTGIGNIAIGRRAGYSETGSYKLYIASGATSPLIYGDFTLQCVDICNNLNVNGAVKIKTVDDGTCGNSVLVWDSGTCCVKKVPYISGSTGYAKCCSFIITGNSSNVGFLVNHALSKQFVMVQVVEAASPYATIYTDVQRTNANCVCVCFDTAPPNGTNYCIIITG